MLIYLLVWHLFYSEKILEVSAQFETMEECEKALSDLTDYMEKEDIHVGFFACRERKEPSPKLIETLGRL